MSTWSVPALVHRMVWCSLFLPLLSGAACDLLSPAGEQVAIRVGERKISVDRVRRDIERICTEMELSAEEIRPVLGPIVDRVVERYVILAYGAERGITVSEPELEALVQDIKSDYPSEEIFRSMLLQRYVDFDAWEKQLEEQLLLQKIIETAMNEIQPATFQEIQEEYERHREAFRHPAMVRFRQMVAQDRETAEGIVALAEREGSLASLVRQAGERFEKAVGMADRWVTEAELEASLAEAVFSLPVGLSDEPVKTPYGYHVVEVTGRRPPGLMRLPEVMEQIEERLLKEKQEAFYRSWIESLKTRFPVTVNRDVLNRLWVSPANGSG